MDLIRILLSSRQVCIESTKMLCLVIHLPGTCTRNSCLTFYHFVCVSRSKVPVAAVSGLEVFDEGADQWYRPELNARRHWRAMRVSKGDDPDAFTETVQVQPSTNTTQIIPWHSRYLVLMPGELLQITSGDEVTATVHRVVASSRSAARLSAPFLLRGRPGTILDCNRYLGGTGRSDLLDSCHGMTIEAIHDALQLEPSPK